jgi:stage II sporulation protein D
VRRTEFFFAAAAVVAVPRPAWATGGLDVENPESLAAVRVLLASGRFQTPQPIDAWRFAWSGRTYRGAFATVRLPDGQPGLINTLPLDAYLYGVLGKEISASWAPGAQGAQAIASRTYVLGRLRPAKPYDVVAAETDQQYGGLEGESVECRAAIDATAGQVVTYDAVPARVAYSACCGGRTADAADVWKTPYPYLTSIPDPNCEGTPNFSWTAEVPAPQVESALGDRIRGIGELRDVRVECQSAEDRPTGIAFVGADATYDASPVEVRSALGTSLVRSTFVRTASLRANDGVLELAGTGRGHGVGMCQRGARVMGERGVSAADILAFYFPGTALGRA